MEKSHMCLPVTFDWLTSKCFRNLFKKLEHCSNRVNLFPKQKFWILLVIHQKLLFRKLVSETLFRKLSLVYQGLNMIVLGAAGAEQISGAEARDFSNLQRAKFFPVA